MIKKLLHIILFVVFAIGIFSWNIFALTITPDTENVAPNSTRTYTITVRLPGDPVVETLDGVIVYLEIVGGTVTGFTPDTAFSDPPVTSECPGGTTYTSGLVCAGFAKSTGYFVEDETLGTFTVQWGSTGTGTITSTDLNMYLDSVNETTYVDARVLGTYTITTVTSTPTLTPTGRLPESGIIDEGGPIIFGALLLISGFSLYKYSSKNYSSGDE